MCIGCTTSDYNIIVNEDFERAKKEAAVDHFTLLPQNLPEGTKK
jgi:hypothetical protein